MNVALRKPWTVDRFLAWEQRQALRYEFDGFQPVAMVGGSEAHADIQSNLMREVGVRLQSPCRVIGSELKLSVGGRIRYPDAMILCTPRQRGRSIVNDPLIVFEILSPSTAAVDTVQKTAEYATLPSVKRYVILQQTHAMAMAFVRKGDDWVMETFIGADAVLRLPEVAVEVPLAEIYRDVLLDDAAEPEEA